MKVLIQVFEKIQELKRVINSDQKSQNNKRKEKDNKEDSQTGQKKKTGQD
jgi:hypothetical protein